MNIRKVEKNDLQLLANLLVESYEEGWSIQRALEYLEKFYDFEPDGCLLAEDGEKILGAVFAYSYYKKDIFIVFLQELFVAPNARHKGIAREIISKLRNSFEENPRIKVTPQVNAPNSVFNFYNSLGFDKEKIFSFYDE